MKDTENAKWALDTNILVYLLDASSPYHDRSRRVILRATQEKVMIAISHQVILELIDTLKHDYHLSDHSIHQKITEILDLVPSLVPPSPSTLTRFLRFYHKLPKIQDHFDLYLVATLLDNNISTLVTNDKKGFRHMTGLAILTLDDF